jgi:peptidoglycan/xylan/chitin deacetylase (PgdA/CDA1 family)
MREKKLLLARTLRATRALDAVRLVTGPSLIVLNYHRLRSDDPREEPAFEEGVFGPTARQFEQQMRWLARNTEVLGEGDVLERLESGKAFGAPSSLVTFDDGYADNHAIAFPILRRLGLPAIFFIPTGLVSSRRLGWWDIVAYVVKRSGRSSIRILGEEISLSDRRRAIHQLIEKVKRRHDGPEPYSLEELAGACDVPLPSTELQAGELMTWEQLREVSRCGIAIGSHTHSHPVLSMLGREAQGTELRTSKEILERELGTRVRSVAYPFGGRGHFGPDSMSVASECGYELGFSFRGGANRGRIMRYGIKRFQPPDDCDLMAASILLPALFQ